MKNLFALIALSTAIYLCPHSHASTNCSLTLKSKKVDAASAKIGDVTFSKKQIEALKSQCTVSRSTFSNAELIQLETLAYNKRVKKLKGE